MFEMKSTNREMTVNDIECLIHQKGESVIYRCTTGSIISCQLKIFIMHFAKRFCARHLEVESFFVSKRYRSIHVMRVGARVGGSWDEKGILFSVFAFDS